jgi:hypothetical protein
MLYGITGFLEVSSVFGQIDLFRDPKEASLCYFKLVDLRIPMLLKSLNSNRPFWV